MTREPSADPHKAVDAQANWQEAVWSPAAENLEPSAAEEDLQLKGGLCEGEVGVHPLALHAGPSLSVLVYPAHCKLRTVRQLHCRSPAAA